MEEVFDGGFFQRGEARTDVKSFLRSEPTPGMSSKTECRFSCVSIVVETDRDGVIRHGCFAEIKFRELR